MKRRILVIDDSSELLELSKVILEMDNYEVITVLGGQEALAMLSEIDEPHLILLDLQMGNMSGLEFLERLEEEYPEILENVPVVFLTAMGMVPPSKAVGFIQKPMEIDHFLANVHRFLINGPNEDGYHPK